MNFIKIKNNIINVDLIEHIEIKSDEFVEELINLHLYYSNGSYRSILNVQIEEVEKLDKLLDVK